MLTVLYLAIQHVINYKTKKRFNISPIEVNSHFQINCFNKDTLILLYL